MSDLMHRAEVRELVAESYRAVEQASGAGAGLYTDEELAQLPPEAAEWSLGVGNPVAHADLRPGDVVLDIGSGGGIDTLLAARRVAPGGRGIGLDLLSEMCERARSHATEAGVDNVEFLEGEMEAIPLPEASVDAVISNGVINLSARKMRVLHECVRVMRPGARFSVADLVIEPDSLPTEVLVHPAAWAG